MSSVEHFCSLFCFFETLVALLFKGIFEGELIISVGRGEQFSLKVTHFVEVNNETMQISVKIKNFILARSSNTVQQCLLEHSVILYNELSNSFLKFTRSSGTITTDFKQLIHCEWRKLRKTDRINSYVSDKVQNRTLITINYWNKGCSDVIT